MSTQHPDNVSTPFFAQNTVLAGDDEIKEAFYAYSHLGCTEQMWDCEGKETDEYVVKKLLTRYPDFFRQNVLGQSIFLTLRVPNPTIERDEAKILLETLESIPRSFDTARSFYQADIPPVFEVILPMVTSVKCLNRVYYYYRNYVAGKQSSPFYDNDITIREWIGDFLPERIHVIPLFEDYRALTHADEIVEEFVRDKDLPYQRVFLARSDPALNYGMLGTIFLLKVALQRLDGLQERLGIRIYPIIGVGSVPFRGNMKPTNVENCLRGYPSCQTFTIQSAFKYDYPPETVLAAIRHIQQQPRGRALPVDEEFALTLFDKVSREYTAQLRAFVPYVTELSRYIPGRRLRKLHIGLFGYSRQVGEFRLPRAIPFCAAMYSIGIPPEILGLSALTPAEIERVKEFYPDFSDDLRDALAYFNHQSLKLCPPALRPKLTRCLDLVEHSVDPAHKGLTSRIVSLLEEKDQTTMEELIVQAANLRHFLG